MWPGTSRSLVTIVAGMLVGLSLTAAVEFSFLLGVITLLAATVYKLKDAGPVMAETYGWGVMLVGSAGGLDRRRHRHQVDGCLSETARNGALRLLPRGSGRTRRVGPVAGMDGSPESRIEVILSCRRSEKIGR